MNFSDLIAHSGSLVRYSPSGELVAIAKNFEVKVRTEQMTIPIL